MKEESQKVETPVVEKAEAVKEEAKGAKTEPAKAGKTGEEAPSEDAPAAEAAPAAPRKMRTKSGKYIPVGIVHVKATFNNTQVTITNTSGAVVSWSSAGQCAFKGSRKSTAYAATIVAQDAVRKATAHGMHEVEIKVQGPGAGRESAIRAVQASGLSVTSIRDVTPIPHNGCRPPKRRRV